MCSFIRIQYVQVEQRHSTTERFGQNRTSDRQVDMKVRDFVGKLRQRDGHLFYLSPQQQQQEEEEQKEDDTKSESGVSENPAFQTPCRQLLRRGLIDDTLVWAGHLRLESCNLWMGHSSTESSSSLHTDYHDNFYVLLNGTKRFRLFSPDSALDMYTHGKIDRVHFNGRISFVGSETDATGTPLNDNDGREMEAQEDDEGELSSEDDNDDVGSNPFGFPSKTGVEEGDDDDESFVEESGRDDYEILVERSCPDTEKNLRVDDDNSTARPDNFSRVDLAMNNEEISAMFPRFGNCRSETIEIKAGQTLYLPAGWFHEVSSISDSPGGLHSSNSDDCPYHMAIN